MEKNYDLSFEELMIAVGHAATIISKIYSFLKEVKWYSWYSLNGIHGIR